MGSKYWIYVLVMLKCVTVSRMLVKTSVSGIIFRVEARFWVLKLDGGREDWKSGKFLASDPGFISIALRN